ncbi:MAG: flagellar basal body rod protein FlgC [Desulfobacteraceae bacterium]|nr:flagellar basal body rod protein FlgC [Desulfobacteraceae bacterium]
MNFLDSLRISASGLSAQRLRMNLISGNLANVNTTRTETGGPYQRKDAVFAADAGQKSFKDTLKSTLDPTMTEVSVKEIVNDQRPPIQKFMPGHPDADQDGYVAMPNINVVEEMVNMLSASRSYEANVTAIKTTKNMVRNALEIGR